METGEETVEGPIASASAAIERAERWAEEDYGSDDVSWFEKIGVSRYHIGMLFADGARSDPLVTLITEADEAHAE